MSSPFTLYTASAGSGKTFALTKSYLLKLLEAPAIDAYKNILAITFTNKAVEEMKSRIITYLITFSKETIREDNDTMLSLLAKELNQPKEMLKKKSKKILLHLLHNYAAFEVSTIDGFTHSVLRTFAKDLGLSQNFEVALNTKEILAEAVDRVIAQAGEDPLLTKTIVDFSLSKIDDDKSWDVSGQLYEIATLLISENNIEYLKRIKGKDLVDFEAHRINIENQLKFEKGQIHEAKESFLKVCNDHQLDKTHFSGGYLFNFFNTLPKKIMKEEFKAGYMTAIADKALYSKSVDQHKKDILDQLQPHIVLLFEKVKKATLRYQFLDRIYKNVVPLALLNRIQNEVLIIKKERNLLLISEFNSLISNTIKDQPAPFIYERLGERYKHYFIDEFQDTSLMQWQNLLPLIAYRLDTSTTAKEGSLMLVGDAKQAIYRFRGGKAQQFIDLIGDKNPFHQDKELISLENNYRSDRAIVDFNNTFFAYVGARLSNPQYAKLFNQANQKQVNEAEGYIDISFFEAKNKDELNEVIPPHVVKIIKTLRQQGVPYHDITVLTRKKNEGIIIASALSEAEIPIISSETLLISSNLKVLLLIGVLKLLHDPQDDYAKIEILEYIVPEYFSAEQKHTFISTALTAQNHTFFEVLQKIDIYFDPAVSLAMPLYDLAEDIARSFKLTEAPDSYFLKLLDEIFAFSQRAPEGIIGFLTYWEANKESISLNVPQNIDAVNIMTIHKSKGLQFPIVIYPYASEKAGVKPNKDNLWIENEPPYDDIAVSYINASNKLADFDQTREAFDRLMAEKELDALNLTYVAHTRAKHQLYILAYDHDKSSSTFNSSAQLKSYLEQKGEWVNGELRYTFGNFAYQKVSAIQETNTVLMKDIISAPLATKGLQLVTKQGRLWDTTQQDAIEKGLIYHAILAYVTDHGSIKEALKIAVKEELITINHLDVYKKTLHQVVHHQELSKYFDERLTIYNERDVLFKGEILRPDRVVISNNIANIIDYKTGDQKEYHRQQVVTYSEAYKAMGYEIGECVLIYINDSVSFKYV